MANVYDQAKQIYSNIQKSRGAGIPLLNKVVSSGKSFLNRLNPSAPIEGSLGTGRQGYPALAGVSQTATPRVTKPVASPIAPPITQPTPVATPTQGFDTNALARNPSFSTYNLSPEVKNAVMNASNKFGVPSQFLFDLFAQESSLQADKVNDTPEGIAAGYPTGLGQFTTGTWKEVMDYNRNPGSSLYNVLPNANPKDPITNALATAYLIKQGQLGKWAASEDVWGNFWTPEELDAAGYYDQTPNAIPGIRESVRLKMPIAEQEKLRKERKRVKKD